MFYKNTESTVSPQKVTMEILEDKTVVKLTDNIQEQVDIETEQVLYHYDEVVFNLPEDREETIESITDDFESWWIYGQNDEEEEITLEERVSALEELYLIGIEV